MWSTFLLQAVIFLALDIFYCTLVNIRKLGYWEGFGASVNWAWSPDYQLQPHMSGSCLVRDAAENCVYRLGSTELLPVSSTKTRLPGQRLLSLITFSHLPFERRKVKVNQLPVSSSLSPLVCGGWPWAFHRESLQAQHYFVNKTEVKIGIFISLDIMVFKSSHLVIFQDQGHHTSLSVSIIQCPGGIMFIWVPLE